MVRTKWKSLRIFALTIPLPGKHLSNYYIAVSTLSDLCSHDVLFTKACPIYFQLASRPLSPNINICILKLFFPYNTSLQTYHIIHLLIIYAVCC